MNGIVPPPLSTVFLHNLKLSRYKDTGTPFVKLLLKNCKIVIFTSAIIYTVNVSTAIVFLYFAILYHTVYYLKQVNTWSHLEDKNQLIMFSLFLIKKLKSIIEQFFRMNSVLEPRYHIVCRIFGAFLICGVILREVLFIRF